ncbi:unnamed protein product [Brachionus calyciflorus]|uniref:Uncharacterized protein n=1 Tax=Brachionus calyciflorus TaxID=104777 RepID=A0A813UP65_9BILA|nr:unnamed protein product [Brachionus calyciflorus]
MKAVITSEQQGNNSLFFKSYQRHRGIAFTAARMFSKKDYRPKINQTYGEFFCIDHLMMYFNIKNTQAIKKLLKLDVNCAHLKSYFKKEELKEIEPLISLLLSKNEKQISDIIRDTSPNKQEMSPRDPKNSKTRSTSDQKFDCKLVKQLKPTLNIDLLMKSDLNSIEKKDLKRLIMYVDNYNTV